MECVRPLNSLLSNQLQCVLSQEPEEHAHFLAPIGIPLVSNAVMACSRGHPFLKQVIENLYWHTGLLIQNDILRATGPFMLTAEYHKFMRSKTNRHMLTLASADTFQPTTDSSMRDYMRNICVRNLKESANKVQKSSGSSRTEARLCNRILRQGFRDKPTNVSFTDHHWTHSWVGVVNDPYNIIGTNKYVDVRTLA